MTLQKDQLLAPTVGAARAATTRYRVLYFMRTRDCPVCRMHVRRLVALRERLAALGAEVTLFAPDEQAPAWAAGVPYPLVTGPAAYAAVGFTKTLGALQQSGTVIATAAGQVLSVRQAMLPPQAFDERELMQALGEARPEQAA